MTDQISHPSYGTLDQFLVELGEDIRAGFFPRIGQINAIAWFVWEYADQQPHAVDASPVVGTDTSGESSGSRH